MIAFIIIITPNSIKVSIQITHISRYYISICSMLFQRSYYLPHWWIWLSRLLLLPHRRDIELPWCPDKLPPLWFIPGWCWAWRWSCFPPNLRKIHVFPRLFRSNTLWNASVSCQNIFHASMHLQTYFICVNYISFNIVLALHIISIEIPILYRKKGIFYIDLPTCF